MQKAPPNKEPAEKDTKIKIIFSKDFSRKNITAKPAKETKLIKKVPKSIQNKSILFFNFINTLILANLQAIRQTKTLG